jgi:hypothetical protein
MSNVKKIAKKTVKITENDLVDLIDNIVNEAVATKKTQWLAEQQKKEANKTALLESKIAALESKFKTLLEGKKK